MHIDRRITNGLAWAGAALIIGVPAADFVVRQFASPGPQAVVVAPTVSEPESIDTAEAEEPVAPALVAAPVQTPAAPATPQQAASGSGDAVDQFVQSGRPLPSYISDGGSAPSATPAPSPQPTATAPAAPSQPAATPPAPAAANPTATPVPAAPQLVTVTMPTPVSQRPASRPAIGPTTAPPVVVQQPALVVEEAGSFVSADDLEDWESGPLSEFLANRARQRSGQGTTGSGEFNPNGFFLDEYYSDFGQ